MKCANITHHFLTSQNEHRYEDDVPRETDGIHVVRVVYNPVFDDEVLTSGRFVASPHVTEFMENADYANGAMADWGM